MASLLHGSARTTPRVRAELQAAQGTTRALAARYGLNPKTVAKWRRRTTTADRPMGPSRPRSSVLTEAEEAIVVEFRRRRSQPHLAAARRRPGLPARGHPDPLAQRPAPLPAAARHLPPAARRGESLQAP